MPASLPRFGHAVLGGGVTAEEKKTLAEFLETTSDYIRDGHARLKTPYIFTDDGSAGIETGTRIETRTEIPADTALPLAYTVEESGEDGGAESPDSLPELYAEIKSCRACALASGRTNPVPGEGVSNPLVMVIGEGPGADEDAAGRPFVGRAGQLLDRMLASISLSREKNCYIANMVKCRPPGNRDPDPAEMAACHSFLERQILLLKPAIILCAGRIAAQNLLKTREGINSLRGKFAELKIGDYTIPVLPSFHPSALLRDDSLRRPAWEDLKLLRSRLASTSEEYSSSLENPDAR